MIRSWFGRLGRAVALLTLLGIGCYVAVGVVIGHQVERAIAQATHHHAGDAVSALIATAVDPGVDLATRDSAIWALGQLGADEALPALRALETGEDCDHTATVCQRGVRRALEGCSGSFNASAPVWRRGDLVAR